MSDVNACTAPTRGAAFGSGATATFVRPMVSILTPSTLMFSPERTRSPYDAILCATLLSFKYLRKLNIFTVSCPHSNKKSFNVVNRF